MGPRDISQYALANKTGIPKIIHQIWLGPHPRPAKWMETWEKEFCPEHGWTYMFWGDEEIARLGLANENEYDLSPSYQQKSDIARYEIVYKYGGMYIDCDMIYLGNDLEAYLPFGTTDFIGVTESPSSNKIGAPYCANGFFAAIPEHPIMKRLIDSIPERVCSKELENAPAWITTGPVLFNACIRTPITIIMHDWIFPLDFHKKTHVADPNIFKDVALVFTYNGQEYPHMKK